MSCKQEHLHISCRLTIAVNLPLIFSLMDSLIQNGTCHNEPLRSSTSSGKDMWFRKGYAVQEKI